MNYNFPVIRHFNDLIRVEGVLQAIEDEEFYIADRGDHFIINYRVNFDSTFPAVVTEADAIRREFRGIIFDTKTGNIIRRPYHKFFNYGEREETRDIDVSREHVILEKLDGSMIAPYIVNDRMIWGTKMGDTDFSVNVADFVKNNPQYDVFARHWISEGYTPIFEFCSRVNRIVIDYPEDRLVLTGIRHMESGEYITYDNMLSIGQVANIDVVKAYAGSVANMETIAADIRSRQGEEGYVVRFSDGSMTKIKNEWYVNLHRAKDMLTDEKKVVIVILDGASDDLKSILPESDKERLVAFEEDLHSNLHRLLDSFHEVRARIKAENMSRKDFALTLKNEVASSVASAIFSHWEDESGIANGYFEQAFLKATGNNARWNEFKKSNEISISWNPIAMEND